MVPPAVYTLHDNQNTTFIYKVKDINTFVLALPANLVTRYLLNEINTYI